MKNEINGSSERGKIIRLAQDYYMREGFYKIPMDTLASELKMSKKTIYKHFPSKEILVEEVVNSFMAELQENINETISKKTDAVSKLESLHEMISRTVIRFTDKWLNDLRIHAPELWRKVDEFRTRKMFAILSEILNQGKKEGLFQDRPNEIMVTMFTASLKAIVNPDFLYYNRFSYSEAVDITFDILFNGFLTAQGKKIYKKKNKREKK
jgi:AcrR family transcriptional regulator